MLNIKKKQQNIKKNLASPHNRYFKVKDVLPDQLRNLDNLDIYLTCYTYLNAFNTTNAIF